MKIKRTKLFEKELKKLKKKHYPIQAIEPCLSAILNKDTNTLKKIKDHSLKGNWQGYREFHPSRYGNYDNNFDSWIVIYKLDNDELVLLLVSTGNHDILKG